MYPAPWRLTTSLEDALPPGALRGVTLVETVNNVFEYSGETHADEVIPR